MCQLNYLDTLQKMSQIYLKSHIDMYAKYGSGNARYLRKALLLIARL